MDEDIKLLEDLYEEMNGFCNIHSYNSCKGCYIQELRKKYNLDDNGIYCSALYIVVKLLGDNKDSIHEAIETGNVNYLKKFPKIGDKVARQIILDLKGKLEVDVKDSKKDFTELTETLKSLGYKPVDIKKVLPNIDSSKSLELQVKEALKLLLK